MDEPNHYAFDVINGIVSSVQRGEVEAAEKALADDRAQREALRKISGQGLTLSEIVDRIEQRDRPTEAQLDAAIATLNKDAADAVAAKEPETNERSFDRFPAPTISK